MLPACTSGFALTQQENTKRLEDIRRNAEEMAGKVGVDSVLLVHANTACATLAGLLCALEHSRTTYLVREKKFLPFPDLCPEENPCHICCNVKQDSPVSIWLQTSGTSGRPKWLAHHPTRLTSAIASGRERARWLLTFEPASFAGVQVMLSALLGGHYLVCPPQSSNPSHFVELAAEHHVSHMSGTPTFWRSFLRACSSTRLYLKSITLGGEIADQNTLDELSKKFPDAEIRHIYATTEMGVIFSVRDRLAGFPSEWIGRLLPHGPEGVTLGLSDQHTLLVSGPRASLGLSESVWDTRDVIEISGQRAYFKGRADTLINVGGYKVFPEEVEEHILKLPIVSDVYVSAQRNPITGSILTADIVVDGSEEESLARVQIQEHLKSLPRHARPVLLRFKDQISLGQAGKKCRQS